MFEKSPQVAPLLVRLYDSHKLYGLVKDNQPQAKAELTTAVAELLGMDLSPREHELLADVLIGLMRQAETDLRLALAERLAALDSVPLRLVLFLANDEISVASPVLCKSPVLSDLDLIYIIKSQGPEYWQAIAGREKLTQQVIDMLAGTNDVKTGIILTRNERITLSEYAVNILGRMALESDELAMPLLLRPELPQSLVRAIYRHAGIQLKEYIRSYFGFDDDVEEAVDDIVIAFAEPQKKPKPVEEFMPTPPMLRAAKKYAELGMLNTQLMMEVLERGQVAQFIALFSKYTGLKARNVHDALKQPQPKGFAIACRAYGIQKSDFSRIFLVTHRMRSNERTVNHKDMIAILEYFDKVRPETAMRVIGTKEIS